MYIYVHILRVSYQQAHAREESHATRRCGTGELLLLCLPFVLFPASDGISDRLLPLCLLLLLWFLFAVKFHVVWDQDQILRISDVVLLGILILMRMSTDLYRPRTHARPTRQARRGAQSDDERGRQETATRTRVRPEPTGSRICPPCPSRTLSCQATRSCRCRTPRRGV